MGTTSPLLDNVRSAVAAELTTLPTYLYPYWSIRPLSDGGSAGGERARRNLMSVILEEMLHMALASNLLNALGGTPSLTTAPFLPVFPCPLLRSVGDQPDCDPVVDLFPLGDDCLTLITRVELPVWDDKEDPTATLGGFYDAKVTALLPDDDASYQHGKQLAPWDNPGAGRLFSITSQKTAAQAITEIKDQGEGTSAEQHDDGDHELAHYWRFKEIQDDTSIDFAKDVYPVVPKPGSFVDRYNTEQAAANTTFNRTYSRMLDALETVLSGDDPDVYPVATGLMGQLHHQATLLRTTGKIPGTDFLPGPTFEYVADER